jgi:hypothetical protein
MSINGYKPSFGRRDTFDVGGDSEKNGVFVLAESRKKSLPLRHFLRFTPAGLKRYNML